MSKSNHITFAIATSNLVFGRVRSLSAYRDTELTLVPVFETKSKGRLNMLSKRVSAQASVEKFKGESGQTLITAVDNGAGKHVGVVNFGIGDKKKFDLDGWQTAVAAAVDRAKALEVKSITVSIPQGMITNRTFKKSKRTFGKISAFDAGKATAEAVAGALYEFNHMKTEAGGYKAKPTIDLVMVSSAFLSTSQFHDFNNGLKFGAIIGKTIANARDYGNLPPNICTPTFMADRAREIAADFSGTVTVEVDGVAKCMENGMRAFCAVGQGSDVPLQFIRIQYRPLNCRANAPLLAYVGKSVTFDSGGLDIKPADGMRDMKYDMCGGADMLAVARAVAEMGLPIPINFYMAATENMTGGKAYRPSDVVVAMDGRTVEVDNTDAEGRMTLIDAIAYARIKDKVTHIVDYATLTGAIVVALGDQHAGVFTNNAEFGDKYMKAAAAAGEGAHMMPSVAKYKKLNDTKMADVKNSGGRWGGAITAADFVLRAAADVPAIHVDIAGTSFNGKDGATGAGVKTLIALARRMGQAKAA